MRILFVAPWLPSRVRPRSLGLIRMLAEHHEIHFIGLTGKGERADDLSALPIAQMDFIPLNRPRAIGRTVLALFSGRSLQQAYVDEEAFRSAVRRAVAQWNPDVIHLNVIRSAHFVPEHSAAAIVIDLDEYRSDYYEQMRSGAKSVVWRILGALEAGRLRKAENTVIALSRAVMLSSPADVERAGDKGVLVRSPHHAHRQQRHETASAPSLLFVGRMCYSANVTAICEFAQGPLVDLRRRHPTLTLDIVGERPTKRVRSLSSEAIRVVGGVPDVNPFYGRATIALVPVKLATGVQMKLIQALAAGVPCVTTRSSAERAGVTAGVHVIVADSPSEWVAAVDLLLNDSSLRDRLSAAGRSWAAAVYSDDAINACLTRVYGRDHLTTSTSGAGEQS